MLLFLSIFNFFLDISIFKEKNHKDNIILLLRLIINKINECLLTFDNNNNNLIIINNKILFLLCLYNFFINNNEELNYDLEPKIILFLNNMKDAHFIYSKYQFETNLNNKKTQSKKKFIIEIILDIYFNFYEKKKFDKVFRALIEGIFPN